MRKSGSCNKGRDKSGTDLETTVPLAELFAALNEQLTAADWQFEAEYTEDIVAWSTWATVQHDEQWRGSLILISNPARPESHYVMFRVRQEEAVN